MFHFLMFQTLYGLTTYALNAARSAVSNGKGAYTCHGNSLPSVQGDRATMMSAIRGIVYADFIRVDEEKIQTGATFVNMTKASVVKLAEAKISDMWMNNQLPSGDSRCRDAPPSEDIIVEAIKGLRNEFGEDIHYAKDSGKW